MGPAQSSGLATRPSGIVRSISSLPRPASLAYGVADISVSTHPGATQFTLIRRGASSTARDLVRSEEHTSELQSRFDLVCRLLLEKKKNNKNTLLPRSEPNTYYHPRLELALPLSCPVIHLLLRFHPNSYTFDLVNHHLASSLLYSM